MQYFQFSHSKKKQGAGEEESPLNAEYLLLHITLLFKYSGHCKNRVESLFLT